MLHETGPRCAACKLAPDGPCATDSVDSVQFGDVCWRSKAICVIAAWAFAFVALDQLRLACIAFGFYSGKINKKSSLQLRDLFTRTEIYISNQRIASVPKVSRIHIPIHSDSIHLLLLAFSFSLSFCFSLSFPSSCSPSPPCAIASSSSGVAFPSPFVDGDTKC